MQCQVFWCVDTDVLEDLLPPSSGFDSQIWATVYWNVGVSLPDSTVLTQKTGMSFICCHVSLILKDSGLLRCDTLLMGETVQALCTVIIPSSSHLQSQTVQEHSFWTVWPCRWRQCDPSKCLELLTYWCTVTSGRLEPSVTVLLDPDVWRSTVLSVIGQIFWPFYWSKFQLFTSDIFVGFQVLV